MNKALRWLLCSYRDLNIEELLIAVSIKRDGTKYRNLKKRKLRNLRSNFRTKGLSGEVRLAHLTIRPCLEKRTVDGQFIFEFSNINLTAALTCLYLIRFSSTEENHLQDKHRAEMEDSDLVDVKGFEAYSFIRLVIVQSGSIKIQRTSAGSIGVYIQEFLTMAF